MAEQVINNSEIAKVGPDAKAFIEGIQQGENMKKLAKQRVAAREALEVTGQVKPSTVINFNPVRLMLHDAYTKWTIPACTDKSAKRIKIEHGGNIYMGSYFTVREPAFVPWIRDVKAPADENGNPTPEFDAKFILPIELADQYHLEYNTQEKQNLTGGVLVFEGDVHTFTKAKGNVIRVPKYRMLSDQTRTYYTEEENIQAILKATLNQQKLTCQAIIQRGDEYNQDDDERKNITPPMRAWAQFSLDMGWKEVAPPWMNASLDSEESCKGCGKGKKKTGAFFCDCGRPFDAFAAFMAGENVPESYLFALKDKELEQVLAELGKREVLKAKFRPKA